LKFLVYSQASNDETIDHLETLYETGSLQDEMLFKSLMNQLITLGKMLNAFIKAVEKEHLSLK
jgi:four helix bundle protein